MMDDFYRRLKGNMKKLFIFDFDGTLFNTINQLVYNMNQALQIHDFPQLDVDEYKGAVGGNIDQLISNVLGDNSTPENITKVKESYLKLIDINEDKFSRPFEGISEILTYLQENNIEMAVNSNRYTYSIEEYIKRFLDEITFLDIQGHMPPNPSKPDAYGVLQILDKTSYTRDETVYVGDSHIDVQTALNAGIDCIIVNWGYSDYDNFSRENILKLINDPMELKEFI